MILVRICLVVFFTLPLIPGPPGLVLRLMMGGSPVIAVPWGVPLLVSGLCVPAAPCGILEMALVLIHVGPLGCGIWWRIGLGASFHSGNRHRKVRPFSVVKWRAMWMAARRVIPV